MTTTRRERHYIILDFLGDPIRKFYTKVDAKEFLKDKDDCTMKVVTKEVEVEEKLDDYELALKTCEPCLF
jgi:ribosomal protein S3AE